MSAVTTIEVQPGVVIDVWVSAVNTVGIGISGGMAFLTAPQVDELIRALAAVRVEIGNARPL